MKIPNVTGLKLWHDPVVFALEGRMKLTPYSLKERRRRRAAGRVAKQARKVNRGR